LSNFCPNTSELCNNIRPLLYFSDAFPEFSHKKDYPPETKDSLLLY
jgi:hypothetical protein